MTAPCTETRSNGGAHKVAGVKKIEMFAGTPPARC